MDIRKTAQRHLDPPVLATCLLALSALLLVAPLAHAQDGSPSLPMDSLPYPGKPPAPDLLESLLEVLASGDQAAYERFVRENYSPRALAEYPAEDHASSLARIFAETRGFRLERITGEAPQWIQAEARDRIAGGRYCLTLNRIQDRGRDLITDFSARGIYLAGSHLTTPMPDELAQTIGELADAYAARDLFSGVILIAQNDDIILHRAYGKASLAFDIPMTLQTRLNIASIGKILTGVAIAQLVDEGRLSYDDLVGELLTDYPDQDIRQRVTVRQLLSHTSGLGPVDYYERPLWVTRSRLRSVADYMKLVIGTPLGGEPGQYHYSNSGYVILGAIIERLTGETYYEYVRKHIFETAGMTHSFYHEMDSEDSDVAVPLTNLFNKGTEDYIYRLGRPRSAVYELAAKGGPQGGAYVSASDLFAFVKALRGGALISPTTLQQMLSPQSPSGAGAPGLTGDAREGLGIEVIVRNGHTFFGHTGGDLGIASMVYWYPHSGYTTILLSNRDPRAARVIANAIRALVTRQTINGAVPPDQACRPPAPPQ